MAALFRILGGTLLTLAVVWGLVLGWWRSIDYQPSRIDLALYLGAIPLALIGGYFLLRGFIDHLKAPPPAPSLPSAAPTDADPLAVARADQAAAERSYRAALIDASMLTAVGESADDIFAAVAAGKRPEPNGQLLDLEGFPVFAAPIEALDLDGLNHALGAQPELLALLDARPDVQRGLALLHTLLGKSAEKIAAVLESVSGPTILQVVILVGADWPAEHLARLQAWLEKTHFAAIPAGRLALSLVPVASDAAALRRVDEAVLQLNREKEVSRLTLVAGAISATAENTIEVWAAHNRLFSASQLQRSIPGEAAVALLLASEALLRQRADADTPVWLSRVGWGVRDKSANASGRVGCSVLEQLVDDVLHTRQVAAGSVKAVCLDTDHRANYVAEALEMVGGQLPQLDPLLDCPSIGGVLGTVTPLAGVLALACASARAVAAEAPVLCLSNQHEFERAALLVWPQPAPTLIDSSDSSDAAAGPAGALHDVSNNG